jgi:menaquinone-specific isochorismate synthase
VSDSSFVAAALEGPARLSVVSVPAPRRPAAASLAALRPIGSSTVVAWLPPDGAHLIGLGSAATLTGPASSGALRREADALLASIHIATHGALPAISPRLLGGFAFAPCAPTEPAWESFGEGRLVLPRWTYGQDREQAWLSLAANTPLTDAERDAALTELAVILEALQSLPEEGVGACGADPARAHGHALPGKVTSESRSSAVGDPAGETQEAWKGRVEAILQAIERGRVVKVVAARSAELPVEEPPDPAAILRELTGRFGRCTGFYLEMSGGAFFGATPERLVRVTGRDVETEALAGSAPPGRGESLLESRKDRLEHQLVLDEIIARLGPLCDETRAGKTRSLELPNVAHLRTPIRARRRRAARPLDLVAALHPTPAVGGVPRDEAVRWIVESEPVGRGWYAGPFGWLDASGDAEFVVALRSALLHGGVARLYAGAGIVSGSNPDAEWSETEAKMRAVREALGAVAGSRDEVAGRIPA